MRTSFLGTFLLKDYSQATGHKLNVDKRLRRRLKHCIYVQFTSYIQGIKICFPNIGTLHLISVVYNILLANTYSECLFEREGIIYSITIGCFKTFSQSAGSFLSFPLAFKMLGVCQTQSFLFKIATVLTLIKLLYSTFLILKKSF